MSRYGSCDVIVVIGISGVNSIINFTDDSAWCIVHIIDIYAKDAFMGFVGGLSRWICEETNRMVVSMPVNGVTNLCILKMIVGQIAYLRWIRILTLTSSYVAKSYLLWDLTCIFCLRIGIGCLKKRSKIVWVSPRSHRHVVSKQSWQPFALLVWLGKCRDVSWVTALSVRKECHCKIDYILETAHLHIWTKDRALFHDIYGWPH